MADVSSGYISGTNCPLVIFGLFIPLSFKLLCQLPVKQFVLNSVLYGEKNP